MATKNRWFMPTNTKTMSMIIAQGLITSPDGFKKYYIDILDLSLGWIPIFKNDIQRNMIEYGVSERKGLVPCIMEFNFNYITAGVVKTIKDDKLIDIEIKDIDKEDIGVVFILAPLPLTVVSQILFKSDIDKKQFEEDAMLRNNVILSGIKLDINQKLFLNSSSFIDFSLEDISNRQWHNTLIDYNKIYALGGMIAILFHYVKDDKYNKNLFIKSISLKTQSDENTDLGIILNYFYSSHLIKSNIPQKVYNNLIDVAIHKKDFKESVIELLESYSPTFATKLERFDYRSDKPISTEFLEAKTLLQKTLLMLFLREDSESLIDYNLDVLKEEDYINFAMLFGIRDKFIKVPKFIREYKNLQHFISSLMAKYAHSNVTTQYKISFKEPISPLTVVKILKKERILYMKSLNLENILLKELVEKFSVSERTIKDNLRDIITQSKRSDLDKIELLKRFNMRLGKKI